MKQRYTALVILATLCATAAVQAQNTPDIAGSWALTTTSPEGENTNTMVVTKEGDTLKAVAKSPQGERAYDSIELKGSDVTIVLTISYNSSPMVITYSGKVDGANMKGDADFGGLAQGSWAAVKK